MWVLFALPCMQGWTGGETACLSVSVGGEPRNPQQDCAVMSRRR